MFLIKPFSSIPPGDQRRTHLIKNFEEIADPVDRAETYRHLALLDRHLVATGITAPDTKWFMPVVNLHALLGTDERLLSLHHDGEALPTDNELVLNPILPLIDRRNWRQKLLRIRPQVADRLVESLIGSKQLILDFLRSVYNTEPVNMTGAKLMTDAEVDAALASGNAAQALALTGTDHPRFDEIWDALFAVQPPVQSVEAASRSRQMEA